MAKDTPQKKAALKKFMDEYHLPKKNFPSAEEAALQAAEDRNYNAPVAPKKKVPVKKKKRK